MPGPGYERRSATCRPATFRVRSTASSPTSTPRNIVSGTRKLRIVGVENIHETAWLPWAAQSIPRRFCSGTAVINDGARHPLFYSIAEDTDIDGFGWGINFCVGGLDRNDAYSPNCRAAKP